MSGLYDNSLTFAGTDLRTFNAIVVHSQILNAPARTYTRVNIPGKNGVRYIDEGTFGNVTQSYTLIIRDNFYSNFEALKNYLLSVSNYARLEEHILGKGDEYYMEARVNGITPRASDDLESGYAIVTFDRLPQKFLLTGESFSPVTDGQIVVNATGFVAKPIVRVSLASGVQSGSLAIYHGSSIHAPEGYLARISEYPSSVEYIDIDSELQDCYYGGSNMNAYVHVDYTDFPELNPGDNFFYPTGVTVQLMPRWWKL